MTLSTKFLELMRALILSYLLTAIILLGLAFLVYQFELRSLIVNIMIVLTYIITCFIGGFTLGKRVKEKRFLWGLALGVFYMCLLFVASFFIHQDFSFTSTSNLTAGCLCIGGGMLGGMLS